MKSSPVKCPGANDYSGKPGDRDAKVICGVVLHRRRQEQITRSSGRMSEMGIVIEQANDPSTYNNFCTDCNGYPKCPVWIDEKERIAAAAFDVRTLIGNGERTT